MARQSQRTSAGTSRSLAAFGGSLLRLRAETERRSTPGLRRKSSKGPRLGGFVGAAARERCDESALAIHRASPARQKVPAGSLPCPLSESRWRLEDACLEAVPGLRDDPVSGARIPTDAASPPPRRPFVCCVTTPSCRPHKTVPRDFFAAAFAVREERDAEGCPV